ncbi:MAG: hypothetical protein J7K51_08445 [Thermotogae bacterium]|nr:hypothetical protein [Thermotogota bacterium]
MRIFISLTELMVGVVAILLALINPTFILLYFFVFLRVILHILGLIKELDEREAQIENLSGNVAFFTSVIIAILFLAMNVVVKREILYLFLLIPPVLKTLFFIFFTSSKRTILNLVGIPLGTLLLSFALLSHGFSVEGFIESIPGIFVLFLTWLGGKFNLVGGIGFYIYASVFFYFCFRLPPINAGKVLVFALVGVPIIFLGTTCMRKEV